MAAALGGGAGTEDRVATPRGGSRLRRRCHRSIRRLRHYRANYHNAVNTPPGTCTSARVRAHPAPPAFVSQTPETGPCVRSIQANSVKIHPISPRFRAAASASAALARAGGRFRAAPTTSPSKTAPLTRDRTRPRPRFCSRWFAACQFFCVRADEAVSIVGNTGKWACAGAICGGTESWRGGRGLARWIEDVTRFRTVASASESDGAFAFGRRTTNKYGGARCGSRR